MLGMVGHCRHEGRESEGGKGRRIWLESSGNAGATKQGETGEGEG